MRKAVCLFLLVCACPLLVPARSHDKVALMALVDDDASLGVIIHVSKRMFISPDFGMKFPDGSDRGRNQLDLSLGAYYIWLQKEYYQLYSGLHLRWFRDRYTSPSLFCMHELVPGIVTGLRFPVAKRLFLFGETAINLRREWMESEYVVQAQSWSLQIFKTALGIIFFL